MGIDVWFGTSRQQQLFYLGTGVFWLLVENDGRREIQEQGMMLAVLVEFRRVGMEKDASTLQIKL